MAENVTYTLFQMAKEMDAEIARLRAENEELRAAPAISGGMVSVPREVVEFLCGAAPLDGVWFSERHPTETGAFWWRRRLRALAAADRSAS